MSNGWVLCWPAVRSSNPEIWKVVVRRCVRIPLLIERLPPIMPGPPPELSGPHPEPWLLSPDFTREAQHRLQLLATIHELARSFEPEVCNRFQKLAQESVGKLPEDIEIHFDGAPEMRA